MGIELRQMVLDSGQPTLTYIDRSPGKATKPLTALSARQECSSSRLWNEAVEDAEAVGGGGFFAA